MPRWIAFDEETARALRARETGAEMSAGDALTVALDSRCSVVVLPGGRGDALVVGIQHYDRSAPFEVERWTDQDAVGYAAGGMLGLRDEPVYEEEKPKKWWQRLLD